MKKIFLSMSVLACILGSGVAFAGKVTAAPGGGGSGSSTSDVTNLTAVAGSASSINLTWTNAANTGNVLVAYSATAYPSRKCPGGLSAGAVQNYTINGLLANKTYYIKVCAVGTNGTITNGKTALATTLNIVVPPPPPPSAANLLWYGVDNQSGLTTIRGTNFCGVMNRVYSVGMTYFNGGERQWYIEARDGTTGALASTFGTNGIIILDTDGGNNVVPNIQEFANSANSVYHDSQQNVLVCGGGCVNGTCTGQDYTGYGMAIIKFDPSGQELWRKFPIGANTSCNEMLIKNEGGFEKIYAYGKNNNTGKVQLVKLDSDGNLEWTDTPPSGTQAINISYYDMNVGVDAAYYLYKNDSGTNVEIRKVWLDGTLAGTIDTGVPSSDGGSALRTGMWNGTEYLWFVGQAQQFVRRYNTDLTLPAPIENGLGCHNLDLAAFNQIPENMTVYDLKIKTTGTSDYLYLVGRIPTDATGHDARIMRFRMDPTACVSENGSGEAFDTASHSFNFTSASGRDSFISVGWGSTRIFAGGYTTDAAGLRSAVVAGFSE